MFPIYVTKMEGELHNVKFRSEVKVNDDTFCSLEAHLQRKEAELDAAQVACTSLLGKCDDVTLRIEKVWGFCFVLAQACLTILHSCNRLHLINRPQIGSSSSRLSSLEME